jgi:hypothetical protein
VTEYASLVDSLRAAGIEVAHAGETTPPFLSAPGRVARANGDLVQLYAYRDSAAAVAEARRISPDGFVVGGRRVAWLGPPRFYRRGRLLALQIGDSEPVRRTLEAIFGPPIAGVVSPGTPGLRSSRAGS